MSFLIAQSGNYTKALANAQPGSTVYLEGPFGALEDEVSHVSCETPVVYIGLRAGVGPLVSLLRSQTYTRENHLLWITHNETITPLHQELQQDVTGGALTSFSTHVGRVHNQELAQIVGRELLLRAQFVIIGPSPAVLSISN